MPWSVRSLLVLLALTALPATAHAATPFTAGAGSDAAIAVGSDGSGHVVWATTGDNVQVGYCRVSAGATACNRSELLNFATSTDANNAGRPQVFAPAPNKVVIVATCWDCPDGIQERTYRWTSTDNGATFDNPTGTQIGSGLEGEGFGLWLDDLGGGIFVAASGSRAKAATADGEGIQYATGGLFVYGPEIARVPGTTKLVAATNDLDVVKYGVYTGPGTVPEINTVGNWLIDRTLPSPESDNDETSLNSGSSGLHLTYRQFIANDSRVGLRRFDPATNTFGAATYVEGANPIDDHSLDHPDSFQDASGRLHVVWRSLYSGGRLRYRVSDAAGGNFSPAANLAVSETFNQPEIAAAANGMGFATWTVGTAGAIRVVPIDPTAESVPGAPGDPTGGSDPGITGARVGDRTLFPGQSTTFRFTSSRAGLAVLTFEKRVRGLKGKRKGSKGKRKGRRACVAATKKRLRALRRKAGSRRAYRKLLKKRGCKRWTRIGRIRQAVQPGANSIAFNGRIAGRKLGKGRYRGRLVITDAAGIASRTETIKFKVVAKKKRARNRR